MFLAAGLVMGCAQDPDKLKVSITTPSKDQAIGVGDAVEFDAKVKGGEAPVAVLWNFDSTGVGVTDPETSSERSPGSVTFGAVGEYVITISGEDDALQKAEATVKVTASYETFVRDFLAEPGNEFATLSWTAPSHPDYQHFLIRRGIGSYPAETTDGENIEPFLPLASPVVDADVINDTEYFYTIFAYDSARNFGKGIHANITPADATAPGSPAPLIAVTVSDTQIDLSWVLPIGGADDADLVGVKVQASTSGYPFLHTDGITVCNVLVGDVLNDSCSATGLVASKAYYFSAFAYDDASTINYSERAPASATTNDPP